MVWGERERVGYYSLETRVARICPYEACQLGYDADENKSLVVSVFGEATAGLEIPNESASQMGFEKVDLKDGSDWPVLQNREPQFLR